MKPLCDHFWSTGGTHGRRCCTCGLIERDATELDRLAFFCRICIRDGWSARAGAILWRESGEQISDALFRRVWNEQKATVLR